MRSRCSGAIPGPLSRTVTRTWAASQARPNQTQGATTPGPPTASKAFCSRFIITCCSWPALPMTVQGAPACQRTSTGVGRPFCTQWMARSITSTRFTGTRSSESIAEKRLSPCTMSAVRCAPSSVPSISEGRSPIRCSMRSFWRSACSTGSGSCACSAAM